MAIDFPLGLGNVTYEYDYFCLAEGTPILVRDSSRRIYLKKIEDIRNGDEVVSVNRVSGEQEWKRALLTKRRAPNEILDFRAKTSFSVTDRHKMLLPGFNEIPAGALRKGDYLLSIESLDLPRTREFIDLASVSELSASDKVCITKKFIAYNRRRGRGKGKICTEGHFPRHQKLDYDFGVFAGLYLAEGSRSPQTSVSFCLGLEESEVSDFISEFSDSRLNIVTKVNLYPEYGRRVAFLHRKLFTEVWTKLFSGDCYSKHLPYWVFDAPSDFKLGILHGWIIGDGTVSDRGVSGKTASFILARGVHDIALSLGIHSSISPDGNSFQVAFYGKDNIQTLFPFKTWWKHDEKIRNYLRSTTINSFLDAARRFEEPPKRKSKLVQQKITKADRVQYNSDWVYDLTVEDNHNFIIGEIVTHNSGSQVLVYFEDVLVDDVVRIAFSVQQNRAPVYGYASQYFNGLADGVVIAGGSFWIAYKEAGYIPMILRYISSRRGDDEPLFGSPALRPQSGVGNHSGLLQSAQIWQGEGSEGGARQAGVVTRADIQRLMRAEAAGTSDAELQRTLNQYSVNISAMSDQDFEDMAEIFEDALWYGGNSERSGRADAMSGNFAGGEIEDGAFLAIRRADQFPPFDIIVTFGDMNEPASNHTVQRLTDCVVTNTQFGPIEPSGEPLYVQFDFIARNLM